MLSVLFFYFFVEKRRIQCVKNKYKGKKEMKNYVNRNRPREQTNEDDPQQALCVRANGEHYQTIRQRHPGISGQILHAVRPEDPFMFHFILKARSFSRFGYIYHSGTAQ